MPAVTPIRCVTPTSTPRAPRTTPAVLPEPDSHMYDGDPYTEKPRVPTARRHPTDTPTGTCTTLVVVSAAVGKVGVLFEPLAPPMPANAPNPNELVVPPNGSATRAPYAKRPPAPDRTSPPSPPLN